MKMAVYAGTFDPFTRGHLHVVEEELNIGFEHVTVLIANNPNKTPLFTLEQRGQFILDATKHLAPRVSARFTNGFVVDYARSLGARVLLRGIRGASDLNAELELAQMNRSLFPEVSTVFVPGASTISSSELKSLVLRGEPFNGFCTTMVAAALIEKLKKT